VATPARATREGTRSTTRRRYPQARDGRRLVRELGDLLLDGHPRHEVAGPGLEVEVGIQVGGGAALRAAIGPSSLVPRSTPRARPKRMSASGSWGASAFARDSTGCSPSSPWPGGATPRGSGSPGRVKDARSSMPSPRSMPADLVHDPLEPRGRGPRPPGSRTARPGARTPRATRARGTREETVSSRASWGRYMRTNWPSRSARAARVRGRRGGERPGRGSRQ